MKLKLPFALSTFLFFLVCTVCAQENGKTYTLQSMKSGKYIDVQWANEANGTPLHIWPFNGDVAQRFTLEDAGDGYYYIKSDLGKYIHVQNDSSEPKALAVIWEGKGNNNTKWKFEDAGNGSFYIKSKKGTYLDVKWGSEKDGALIWMWSLAPGASNQQWKLTVANSTVNKRLSNSTLNDIDKPISGNVEPKQFGNSNKTRETVIQENYDDEQRQMYCTSKKVSVDESPQEDIGFLITSGDASEIYPGAIFKADAFTSGSYEKPNLKFNDYDISIDLLSDQAIESGASIEASESGYISKAKVNNAIGTLLRNNNQVKNAQEFVYTVKKIDHEKELDIMAYGSYSGFGVDVKADFSFNEKTKRNFYIARFYQKFHSISVDSDNIIDLELSEGEIKSDDLYISEVTYGRVGYIKIVSKYNEKKIKAALDFVYEGGGSKAAGGVKVNFEEVNQDWEFTAYAIGGKSDVFTDADGFKSWMGNSEWDPAAAQKPIGYKLKFLRGNKVADVRVTSEFVKRECRPYAATRVLFLGLQVKKGRHNRDCDRIGHTIRVSVYEVDNRGNKTRDYLGRHENNQTGNVLLISNWRKNEGFEGRKKKWVHRNDLVVNPVISNHILDSKNLNNGVHPYIEYKIDQAALEDNRVVVEILNEVQSCHKSGDRKSDFHCWVSTKETGHVIKKRVFSDIMNKGDGLQSKVDFETGLIPATDGKHGWSGFFRIENF